MPHRAHRSPLDPFGNTGLRPSFAVFLWTDDSSGCTEQQVLLVHCVSQVEVVPQTFLTFPGQADVGISGSLQTGLGFFGHPKAAPAGPALRLGWPRPTWPRLAAFPCSAFSTGGFRSALYTGSPSSSRRVTLEHPDPTAYLFGSSLSALIWLVAS
jgi:hypothetical protein